MTRMACNHIIQYQKYQLVNWYLSGLCGDEAQTAKINQQAKRVDRQAPVAHSDRAPAF